MAIITEFYRVREDGVILNRTYSDKNVYIEREGVKYCEAVEPAGLNRNYVETNEPIKNFEFIDNNIE